MSVSDHLNTARDVLNMAEVPYVDDFYRARAALDAIEAAWNSAYDLPTPRLIAEVVRLRGELRRIEHYPFDVMSDAETDLRAVKEIARVAASGGEE